MFGFSTELPEPLLWHALYGGQITSVINSVDKTKHYLFLQPIDAYVVQQFL